MASQTKSVGNKTGASGPILIGMLVLLLGLCVVLASHDGLRNAFRSMLGLPPTKSVVQIDHSAEENNRRQLLEISAALGLVAVSNDMATLVKAVAHDRDDLRFKNGDLNRKHVELDARYRDLDTKHGDLQTKHVALDHQHKQLQFANGELDRQHQQVKAEKIQFETRTKHAASKFSRNLSSRLAKSTARQVTSAPAESIPFIGIPLIAAFTAWDLYDACETMKALNELGHELSIETQDGNAVCGVKLPTVDDLQKNGKHTYENAKRLLDEAGRSINN